MKTNAQLFTPFDPYGLTGLPVDDMNRVLMRIDYEATIPRGQHWTATIRDLQTGRSWRVRDAICGVSSCRCAAEIVEEVTP